MTFNIADNIVLHSGQVDTLSWHAVGFECLQSHVPMVHVGGAKILTTDACTCMYYWNNYIISRLPQLDLIAKL